MPIKVLINDSPLKNANAIRGVGAYTRFLTQALAKNKSVELALTSEKNTDFKPEITHYPFFDLFFSTLPLINKGKTIVTIHDVIPLLYPKYYPIGKKGLLALIRQKVALKSVNAVITDSNNSKTDIAKYLRFPLDKIYVVPLASNPNLRLATAEEIKKISKKYKLAKKYLLYVGDINYNKNLPQLIKTLKFLPKEIHLLVWVKIFFLKIFQNGKPFQPKLLSVMWRQEQVYY
jgi:glycosyltransferase involved in cell wall biosynthesis